MIDTIVLLLDSTTFHIAHPEMFTPSARWVQNTSQWSGITSKQNPTKTELCNGIYKPRLSLSHRMNVQGLHDVVLRIELSLPKLMFGNNFEELQYKDFAAVVKRLTTALYAMGVIVDEEQLIHSPVVGIHYSKNIVLTDGSTPYHYIQKIKEADVSLALDINQTDYRNAGHSYKWHCNAYEVVFYDKLKDLEAAKKSSKRALEKDNELQLNLLDKLRREKKFEVLRMEVRLNKRQKMKQLFEELGITADLTFKKLFKPAISKKVLLHYLDELDRKRPLFLDYTAHDDKTLLAELIINNPELSYKKIMQLFGLKKALESFSLRELRILFPQKGWQRLLADMQDTSMPKVATTLRVVREAIEKPLL